MNLYQETSTKIDRVRFRSREDPQGHPGDWLLVTPSEPRLTLANDEFRFIFKLRLGLQVAALPDDCPCGHRNHEPQVDLGLGYHSMNCHLRGFNGFAVRHKWLVS